MRLLNDKELLKWNETWLNKSSFNWSQVGPKTAVIRLLLANMAEVSPNIYLANMADSASPNIYLVNMAEVAPKYICENR